MEPIPGVCVVVELVDHAIVNMNREPDSEPVFF